MPRHIYLFLFICGGTFLSSAQTAVSPAYAVSLGDGGGDALLNGAQSFYVSGNYAYVMSITDDALEIVEISNPAAPAHQQGTLTDGTQNPGIRENLATCYN